MIYYIDIDETICTTPNTRDYNKARPIKKAIDKVNRLFEEGHTIVFWTARGTLSGIDWTEITKCQLRIWGVKYHELKFGKPVYDCLIDDKAFNASILLEDK